MSEMLSRPSRFLSAFATLEEKIDTNRFGRERELCNPKRWLCNSATSGFGLKKHSKK